MAALRYAINVTIDGCVDHREGVVDEELHRHHAENLLRADGLLFGRTTYEMMEAAWRNPAPEIADDPFVQAINAAQKFVVSRTRTEVGWNSRLITGDLRTEIERLKADSTDGIAVGGVTLPAALAQLGLIDEYQFVIHPRVAGHGPYLFAGLEPRIDLDLIGRSELGSGAVVLDYRPRR